jgi:hypothetical protein
MQERGREQEWKTDMGESEAYPFVAVITHDRFGFFAFSWLVFLFSLKTSEFGISLRACVMRQDNCLI